jgi:hypothetical protein
MFPNNKIKRIEISVEIFNSIKENNLIYENKNETFEEKN